jgi:REP element-mobilizing transposase RayT
MPHTTRRDRPGDWFHLFNRAIARRTMFEHRADIEFFLDRLGETVANGWLEIHSYAVLTTHFHLLVRSPAGEMPRALHHVQLNYSRYFNRTRKRDGPLVRGRYRSLLVDTPTYRRVLVGYIDANPVAAGLSRRPDEYPFGSCRAYVLGQGPAWLSRDMVRAEVLAMTGARTFDGARYVDVFRRGFTEAQRELVELRVQSGRGPAPTRDDLLHDQPIAMANWLRRKALLADGTTPGVVLVAPSSIDAVVAAADIRPPLGMPAAAARTPWPRAARVVLLAELCGLTQHAIAARLHVGRDAARNLLLRGRQAIATDGAFAAQLGHLGSEAMRRTFGTFARSAGSAADLRPAAPRGDHERLATGAG